MKRIFISSTYTDLKSERKAAIEIVDREQHAVAMEKFFAEDHQAKDVCLQKLENCDGVILIVGDRYGSIDPTDGVSITEIEYTTAKSLGIPVFVLIKTRDDGSWQSAESEPDRLEKHEKLKKRVDEEKHRKTFQNPDQLQTEILGAIANYEREHGELGIRLRAFVTPDDFFKPFADPSRLFNHRWTLVGRSESLRKLHGFVRSNKKVATIYGRGTVGKTKLLFEFSRTFRSRHRNQRLLFLRDGVALDQEAIKQIPSQRAVIVVDDAHRRGDLKCLLQTAQQYPERIKLFFSARPQGKDFIKTSIAEVGFDTQDIEDLADLKDLTRAELKQLAAQVLGQKNKNLLDSLVASTGDSPLVTLVGAQLLRNHSIDPRLLERDADFQYTVLSRFQDAITGTITDRIDRSLSQNLLALISALAPIRPHEQQFQDAAAAFLDIQPRIIKGT